MLQLLRGDFFCFPFGVTEGLAYPHGETANRIWAVETATANSACFKMDLEAMPGSVIKRMNYHPGSNALWQEHVITGVEGRFNYGHHSILQVPANGIASYATSPWKFGQVHPDGLAVAADGDKGILKPGARFVDLDAVPTTAGSDISLTRYPHDFTAEDIVMLSQGNSELAWNAFSLPDFLWLSVRRVADFPSTLLWLSNGGRPRPPWNGSHAGRIGIEDVCSYFHEGADRSRLDLLKADEIVTSRKFQLDQPTHIQHLQMAIPLDAPFGYVSNITYDSTKKSLLISGPHGKQINWPCPFSFSAKLASHEDPHGEIS